MNTSALAQMPGYRTADYQLILNPHEDLRNRIIHIKKEFADKYQTPFHNNKPHITLARFNIWELMEIKLVNHLNIIAMALPPVRVALKDYHVYPSHTIYINVASKLAVENIIKELREAKRLMKSPDHDPHFI